MEDDTASLAPALDPPAAPNAPRTPVADAVGGGREERAALPMAKDGTMQTSEEQERQALIDKCADEFNNYGWDAAWTMWTRNLPSRLAELPSTHLHACEAMRLAGAEKEDCVNLLMAVLDVRVPSAQTHRMVAYRLLELGWYDLAVAMLTEVKNELAPAEVHSLLDVALARFFRLRAQHDPTAEHVRGEIGGVVDDLARVVEGRWEERFAEIEWPALLLLSWAAAWGEWKLRGMLPADTAVDLWPERRLPAERFRLGGAPGPQLGLVAWLGWDTDHTDIDLHVREPLGEKDIYYNNNVSSYTGARLSRDFREGYGPEVYTLHKAPEGPYTASTKYFANHQPSRITGSTSAIVVVVQRMGEFGNEEVAFKTVRLTANGQMQELHRVQVVAPAAAKA